MSYAERFLLLLEPHRERLLVISASFLHRRADAEDVLQEAILKAWRDFPHYRECNRFGAWVLRYLLNTVRNRNRRLQNELEVPLAGELEDPETILEWESDYESFFEAPERVLEALEDRLADAIRRLPLPERTVLLLRTVGELTCREIGEVLGVPEGTAMSHLSRARKRLRVSLAARQKDSEIA